MDRHELLAALSAAGVPDGYYRIEGVHEPAPTPPDFVYLARSRDERGAWETGVYERGAYEAVTRHASESEACAELLRLLT
ncbi:hypothetical protein AR457_31975 [Streptomyces agglomeratus]|uniref:Uncharacterized protein n=1 Tax=Streptomyces agglomeratus TaxID=285458 RepID=A0A1E5PFU4_9ACTN|nr:hypothetical protein [Streptomyces agglomeratus]OEJ28402.1 hypothetical protein AS594_31880 [Streptomyces agglomeratus]OEJ37534.1 hypothetical protein BGK70_04670 [Streptomyces agglomeratus]OEJ48081.1 hypothetical protein AR457_31975 [Streptomyces agglomeratus]OEJ50075.1 hypothetical protein BGK72_04185 [Streptomyces agglomeratus]OEJ57401.1 hypothetical protein BGM19_04865 [Streptomyces agglomeratus]